MTDEATANDMAEVVEIDPSGPALDERNVRLGTTDFVISKPKAMEGKRIIEVIRNGLLPATNVDTGDTDTNETVGIKFALALIPALPIETVDELQRRLFANVQYTTPKQPTSRMLAGNEDAAFEDLEPAHIYEMIVRCLVVGFLGSWGVIGSLIRSARKLNPRQ